MPRSSKPTPPAEPPLTALERCERAIVDAIARRDEFLVERDATLAKLLEYREGRETASLDEIGSVEAAITALERRLQEIARRIGSAETRITEARRELANCEELTRATLSRYADVSASLPRTLADAERRLEDAQRQRDATARDVDRQMNYWTSQLASLATPEHLDALVAKAGYGSMLQAPNVQRTLARLRDAVVERITTEPDEVTA